MRYLLWLLQKVSHGFPTLALMELMLSIWFHEFKIAELFLFIVFSQV